MRCFRFVVVCNGFSCVIHDVCYEAVFSLISDCELNM